jgi:hypothetical protein
MGILARKSNSVTYNVDPFGYDGVMPSANTPMRLNMVREI